MVWSPVEHARLFELAEEILSSPMGRWKAIATKLNNDHRRARTADACEKRYYAKRNEIVKTSVPSRVPQASPRSITLNIVTGAQALAVIELIKSHGITVRA